MFQGAFKCVSRKFQGYLNEGVSIRFQGCFRKVAQVFHGVFKDVFRKLPGCLKEVFLEVSIVFQ